MKKVTTLIVLAITGIVSVNTFAQGFGGGMNLGAGGFGAPGMVPGAAPAGGFGGPGLIAPGADFGGFGGFGATSAPQGGFGIAPAVGEQMAMLIDEGHTTVDISGLRYGRFKAKI